MRKERRQKLGTLKSLIIKPATKVRYDRAFASFLQYQRNHRLALATELDVQLSDYLEHLWEEGESRYLAADTLSGVQHLQPSVKGHIPQAWRLLNQNELPARAPPFTTEQVEVLCGCTLTTPWMPLALLTGFWGLLRTGELLKIQACHVIPSGAHVLIHLGETKMTSRNAGVENVYIHHIYTAQLLQAWASVAKPHDYLVPVSQYQFRLSFSQAIQKCQFTGFKPYSLRRGGATALYIDTKSYTQVCQQGDGLQKELPAFISPMELHFQPSTRGSCHVSKGVFRPCGSINLKHLSYRISESRGTWKGILQVADDG